MGHNQTCKTLHSKENYETNKQTKKQKYNVGSGRK